MILINFAHPLKNDVLKSVESATGETIDRVIGLLEAEEPATVKTFEHVNVDLQRNFEVHRPFAEQVALRVDEVGLSSIEWQTLSLVVVLPAMSIIAGLVLTEIHGRRGWFVRVLRLKRGEASEKFEFAEIIHLQDLRDKAREKSRPAEQPS